MAGNLSHTFQTFSTAFQDLFFPPVCHHCEQVIHQKTGVPILCETCLNLLQPVPADFTKETLLEKSQPRFLDALWIIYQFNSAAQACIHAVKYQQMPETGKQFGEFVRRQFYDEIASFQSNYIIPIPLHPVRKKERGYNQSEQIAAGIFGEKNIYRDVLRRERYTESQVKLNRARRQENVRNAFAVMDKKFVNGADFVLLDDVFTTGATMNECARVLKENGAATVSGIALATPFMDE